MDQNLDDCGIIKKVLYPGSSPAIFKDNAKVSFHFQTRLCNDEKTLIDDSRKMGDGKPFELVLGKKFKLEVWEAIVQRMAINEVAQFMISKNLVLQYPYVSKTLRDAQIPCHKRKSHCCAATLQQEGVGYDDLNDLLKNPCDIEFTIELLKVEQLDEYQKETWQMDDIEQLEHVQVLRKIGNAQYKEKNYRVASNSYGEALGILERLALKEKPQSEEWNVFIKQKVPLLLNYSQCKLTEGDYYAVIKHCTSVLDIEPDNVKALFKRGKAQVGAWNPLEAKKDFHKVIELDDSLTHVVQKELDILEKLIKSKNKEDKEKFKGLFGS